MPFSNVVLQPDQFALVRRVFDTIVGESWFVRNRENEHTLASVIVREFEHGTTDESALVERCKTTAQKRFSAGTPVADDTSQTLQ